MRRITLVLSFALFVVLIGHTPAQFLVGVASGFTAPAGMGVHPTSGDIYVADTGDGTASTGTLWQLPSGAPQTPVIFVGGLPSEAPVGAIIGPHGVAFRANGTILLAVGGSAVAGQSGHVLEFDTTGNQIAAHDVGAFALTQFAATNIYSVVEGPAGDLYVTDSANDSIFRIDNGTGLISVFSTIPGVTNSTGVGNNPAESVPTKIIHDGTDFYVAAFSGYPHVSGWSQIHQVDSAGVSVLWAFGMTCLNDIAIDPVDNNLTMLSFGSFDATGGFQAFTGSITKAVGGVIKTLSSQLLYPSGMAFNSQGTLFVSFATAGTVSALYSTQTLAGSEEDFVGAGWVYPNLPVASAQPVTAGSYVYFTFYSPACGLCGAEPLALVEAFPTGTQLGTPGGFPSLHVSGVNTVVLPLGSGGPFGSPLVSSFTTTLSFEVPAGLAGTSVRFQALAVTSAAVNGFFAVTDATQFDIF